MTKRIIATPNAPKAIGPYSQAIEAGGLVFLSGQIALDPATGNFLNGDVQAQTRQVLQNLAAVAAAAGGSLEHAVKTTVYLADMGEVAAMNEVYGEFFRVSLPARATVQAARLPKDAKVEIDAILKL